MPDALDSAATAYGKVASAISNAEAKYLKAINDNQALAAANAQLAAQIEKSNAPGLWGTFVGYLEAAAVSAANLGLIILNTKSGMSDFQATVHGFQKFQAEASPFGQIASFVKGAYSSAVDAASQKIAGFQKAAQGVVKDLKEAGEARKGLTADLKDKFEVDEIGKLDAGKVAAVRKELEGIYAAQAKGSLSASQAIEKVNDLSAKTATAGKTTEDFRKVSDRAFKTVQDGARKAESAAGSLAKKGLSAAASEAKRLDAEMKTFSRSVSDALGIDRLPKLTAEIRKAFDQPGREEVAKAVDEIGLAALRAGVPMAELTKRITEQTRALDEQRQAVLNADVAAGNLAGLEGRGGGAKGAPSSASLASAAKGLFGGSFSTDGGFFGFDLGEGVSQESEAGLSSALLSGFNGAVEAFQSDAQSSEKVKNAVSAIGRSVASYYTLGLSEVFINLIGEETFREIENFSVGFRLIEHMFGTTEETLARKHVDKFFSEVLNTAGLAVLVDGELKKVNDIVFRGDTLFGGNVNPGPTEAPFRAVFESLPAEARAAFQGVGAAFEDLLGVSEQMSGELAIALTNNIGGSLNALQQSVQATGVSFEDLGNKIVESFLKGSISIEDARTRLQALEDVLTPGIPDAVGAVDLAFQNLNDALKDRSGNRAAVDGFKDIEAEARERGIKSFQELQAFLIQSGKFTQDQVGHFFEALLANGVRTMEEFRRLNQAGIIAVLDDYRRAEEGLPVLGGGGVKDPTDAEQATSNFEPYKPPAPTSSGGGGQSTVSKAADDAKRAQEQLRAEVYKTLTASKQYADVLDRVTDGQLTNAAAGKEIKKLYADITRTTKALESAEDDYQKALEKGAPAKKLGQLSAAYEKAKEAADKFAKAAKEATKDTFTLAGVLPLIKDLNTLGLVSGIAGVSLDNTTKILVEGFKRGKLSITEVNRLLTQSEDLLGQGIPNAVGAVSAAFDNLVRGGRNGGAFSLDALGDVISETEERYQSLGSTVRDQRLTELTGDFDAARQAKQDALARGASGAELKGFEDNLVRAKKLLDDFNSVDPKAGFEDLRAYLSESAPADQVEIFFRALRDNGLNSFEAIKAASDEVKTQVLGTLDALGFRFGETASDVLGITKGIDDAAIKADGGQDTLGAAVKSLQAYLAGAQALPGSLQLTQGPIAALAADYGVLLDRVALLTQDKNVSVILNVRTNAADAQTEGLFELLFDGGTDGAQVSNSTGTGNSGGRAGGRKAGPKLNSVVNSRTNPGRGYVRVGTGQYKYVGAR